MRELTPRQRELLEGVERAHPPRVRVANASGTLIDLTSRLASYTVEDGEDQPFATGQVTFVRENHQGPEGSLAPLMAASLWNRDDVGSYAPLLALGREVVVDVAVVELAADPLAVDWMELFRGRIERPAWPSRDTNEITVDLEDWLGAFLRDFQIEEEHVYEAGATQKSVMQQILDDALGPGFIVLHVPQPTGGAGLGDDYRQRREGVLAALDVLAKGSGWVVRPEYDAAGVLRLTLLEPDRDAVDPLWTYGPATYREVTQLETSLNDLRNAFELEFPDAATGTRLKLTDEDPASIAALGGHPRGRRWMRIEEPDGSVINSAASATALLAAIKADVAQGPIIQEIETLFSPHLQVRDYLAFLPNGRHYDSEQRGAVAHLRHRYEAAQEQGGQGTERTYIRTSVKPRGAYLGWLTRALVGGPPRLILASTIQHDPVGRITVAVELGPAVVTWRVWARRAASPLVDGTLPPQYARSGELRPTEPQVAFTVDSGPWHVLVRGYAADGRFTEVVAVVEVVVPGEPTPVPGTASLSGACNAGGGPAWTATATWLNLRTDLPVEVQWIVGGAPQTVQQLAAGTTSAVRAAVNGEELAVRQRYVAAGVPGQWSGSLAAITRACGVPAAVPGAPNLYVSSGRVHLAWSNTESGYRAEVEFRSAYWPAGHSEDGSELWIDGGTTTAIGAASADLRAAETPYMYRARVHYVSDSAAGEWSAEVSLHNT